MRTKQMLFIALFFFWSVVHSQTRERSFAIVVDPQTYKEARAEIEQYATSIENSGLGTIIVVDRWGIPDSIRRTLQELYLQKKESIEGAVFIGDIPVPMIRDAQHLTSAFKMNQDFFDKKESSVPSDRFYDDFNLQFHFLERDKEEPSYFYYSLTSHSVQTLSPSIYTARIKANENDPFTKYEKIRKYLQKVVRIKKQKRKVNQVFFFSGSGYISESLLARMDEKTALLESFPWLKRPENRISYLDHSYEKSIKQRLMNKMQREDLDIAILHHHGDPEIQYLNHMPTPASAKEEIADIRFDLRKKFRQEIKRGESADSIKAMLSEQYEKVPTSWFEDAFAPEYIEADSLLERSLNLYVEDFKTYSYQPNALYVILDACYNGSFHLTQYIAGSYLFGEGNTIVVNANSVNALQDKWADRYIGLIGLGARVGYLSQYNTYLENHTFGDPTFSFISSHETGEHLNKKISEKDLSWWKKQLNSPYPAIQAMALRMMSDAEMPNITEFLLHKFKTNPHNIVRLECMELLAKYNNVHFIECLQLSTNDSYEMVQRFGINYMGKSGDMRLIPALVSVLSRNDTDFRVAFNTRLVLSSFPETDLLNALDNLFKEKNSFVHPNSVKNSLQKEIRQKSSFLDTYITSIFENDSLPERAKISNISMLRNYTKHKYIPQLLNYLRQTKSEKEQVCLLEALGWFRLSYTSPLIKKEVLAISRDTTFSKPVRNEALKTYKRLQVKKAVRKT
ncbi:MAG: hypothetical protein PHF73_06750 [Massilibacteroides sp.]|nr:hypothetical protein [Massilibacteroides sp.]